MTAHDTGSSRGRATVVTPGNHDGVHRGHRALVDRARTMAGPLGAEVAALIFDPHPSAVLAPERAPALLTTVPRRRELLREAGADQVAVQAFDRAFAALSPETFVDRVLVEGLGARGVVVGPDFRFGQRRAGDVARLAALGAERGFEVAVVPPVLDEGERISSSRVRQAVAAGEVEAAARWLTRFHEVTGTVVEGHRRGRQIGFPTANLQVDPTLLPADGVYAVAARRLGGGPAEPLWEGVANLGVRPTFEAGRSVEVHLLDVPADLDLYGASLRVGFVARLRGERRFDGLDALLAQIQQDVGRGREVLAGVRGDERLRCL
jgi:riboflavin kinase/FMN adenylyltransferase